MKLPAEQAIEILWSHKGFPYKPLGPEHLYATTTKPVLFSVWQGHNKPEINYTKPAGTRVLVTMISRFGDVGVRARDLEPASHGYDARVMPEELVDWSTTP